VRHVILATVGSHGDVFPFVALGRALRARGNRITLAANEPYRELAIEQQFEFAALVSHEETQAFFSEPDLWHPLRCGLVGARWGSRWLRPQYELLRELARDENSVIAASPGVMAARLVQETLAGPVATIYYTPWMIPSCTAPPAMTGGLTLPRWAPRPVGRLYWRAVDAVGGVLLGRELNQLRASLGLRPVRRIFQWGVSPDLAIGLFPQWYAKPQPDWPSQLRIADFPTFHGPAEKSLDSRVLEFCHAGPPPIVPTFGTGMRQAEDLLRKTVDACVITGSRGVILSRYADQVPGRLPPSIRHFEFVPLRPLLPHCAGIVHHGGIGTVAAALSAGTPQLIIPHAWDQRDNAERVVELGAGAMIRGKQRSAARIAKAVVALIKGDFKERCRAIANRSHGEEGIEKAAAWVEAFNTTPA
jgi:rhamnosyltransferase subunit B